MKSVTPVAGFIAVPQDGDMPEGLELWYTVAPGEETREVPGPDGEGRLRMVQFSHASIDGQPVNNLN